MVFRSVAPKQFNIVTYRENALVKEITVDKMPFILGRFREVRI